MAGVQYYAINKLNTRSLRYTKTGLHCTGYMVHDQIAYSTQLQAVYIR